MLHASRALSCFFAFFFCFFLLHPWTPFPALPRRPGHHHHHPVFLVSFSPLSRPAADGTCQWWSKGTGDGVPSAMPAAALLSRYALLLFKPRPGACVSQMRPGPGQETRPSLPCCRYHTVGYALGEGTTLEEKLGFLF
ncbi:hypothetical protein B0J13DRAFT_648787 [Dactylonectria estremocensis]|uniref:Secreted protein n=1 Tax=Dactylonectria estremocensis TaxID=1079267 RepID=A0A9P9DMJ6_9HYPO|nr:hypothetical protein B0J13DRAFT_648787 [Dactylonectria estremocensis]